MHKIETNTKWLKRMCEIQLMMMNSIEHLRWNGLCGNFVFSFTYSMVWCTLNWLPFHVSLQMDVKLQIATFHSTNWFYYYLISIETFYLIRLSDIFVCKPHSIWFNGVFINSMICLFREIKQLLRFHWKLNWCIP